MTASGVGGEPSEREWLWFGLMCANVFAMSISWTSFLPSLATTMTLSMGALDPPNCFASRPARSVPVSPGPAFFASIAATAASSGLRHPEHPPRGCLYACRACPPGLQPGIFGAAISVYMVGSIVGMFVQNLFPACSINARKAVIGLLLVRIVSSGLHIVATGSQGSSGQGSAPATEHEPVEHWRVYLLLLGRFAHGISVASYVVSFVWIGSFIASNQRKASMIATANTIMLVGSVVGPQMGVAMEFLNPYINPIVPNQVHSVGT